MRRNSFVQMALTGRLGVRLTGGGAASSLDAATVAFLARMTTPPDSTRQALINDFVVGCKADGTWPLLDEIWIPAAHNEQAALLGWKGYKDLTAVNAPTFTTDRGFAGNGTTSYLNTNFVPSTDGVQYTQNDASFGVYSRTNIEQTGNDIGCHDGTNYAHMILRSDTPLANSWTVRTNQDSTVIGAFITNANSTGFHAGRRTASNAYSWWRNGASVGTGTIVSTALPSVTMYIGARNSNGTATLFSTRQYAAAFVGASMSEAQQLALFTRLETYLDAIGAGVVS